MTQQAARRTVPVSDVFGLKPGSIWAFLKHQPAAFWLLNVYMLFEYVRPQSIWTFLSVLPWATGCLLLTAVAAVVGGTRSRYRTAAGPLLIVFTAVLIASSFAAVRPEASFERWGVYFNWILLYILITNIVSTERRFFVFMLGFLLYCLKMSQHGFRTWVGNGFSFTAWGVSGAPGWFQNSGEFGIQMCVFLPLVVEFILALRRCWPRWVRWCAYGVPVSAVASMIASSSRGALVGGAAVLVWWVVRAKHRVRSLLAVAVLAAVVWMMVPPEQKARFDTAGSDNTSVSRTERWKAGIAIANEYPLLGIGYNNWGTYYGPLSHNIFIEAWSEMGYLGLAAFLALIAGTFSVNASTRKLLQTFPTSTSFMQHMAYGLDGALIGYLVSGFFVTVLYYPYFWVNLAMAVALNVSAKTERARVKQQYRAAAAPRFVPAQPQPGAAR